MARVEDMQKATVSLSQGTRMLFYLMTPDETSFCGNRRSSAICPAEFNILWAAHQVHHSSEYYNLTTALRQSVTQQFASWVFYLPMALIVPPSIFAVHVQFNLLYQFWIHTEIVKDLGPLEWILNTPSHHRVHHGTFAPEDDKVIYGLTHPINTFDILSVEFEYYKYLWQRFLSSDGITHKLSVIFNGPGWTPGKPRLGDPDDLPEVTGKEVPHNPEWSAALKAYVHVQFLLVLVVYNNLFATEQMLSQSTVLLITGYILLTLTTLGYIMDQSPNAALWETLRCVLMLVLHRFHYISSTVPLLALATEGYGLRLTPHYYSSTSNPPSLPRLISLSPSLYFFPEPVESRGYTSGIN
ncbi:Alkylglycerol monooxygenase [Bagarius yarrelli]|uniref:Alkylglycerol monooxygenase n=1 Tax=Bagarius yarrelli TaxID=175774 RepID=A0A556U611_BAGYA|nr:Alkylglycerol monooxygenase [Bagarius yarrelli]